MAGDLYGMDTTPNQKRQTVSPFGVGLIPPTSKETEKVKAAFEGLTSKAGVLGKELDLIGSKKIDPALTILGLDKARQNMQKFLEQKIDAGLPTTPYVALNGYDRVMQQLDNIAAKVHACPRQARTMVCRSSPAARSTQA